MLRFENITFDVALYRSTIITSNVKLSTINFATVFAIDSFTFRAFK